MIVTDEMVDAALQETEYFPNQYDRERMRAALEAALSLVPELEAEPFGYFCECKNADPAFLRKPSYIPPTDDLHTTTPLYRRAALSAPAQGAVKVKPLEWRTNGRLSQCWSVIGYYEVQPCYATAYEGQWLLRLPRLVGVEDEGGTSLHLSEEAAFAAAQADYEQRILSALAPTPAHSGEREALERFKATYDSGLKTVAASDLRAALAAMEGGT